MPTAIQLASLYKEAHDVMRNVDGLHPQEAFDELLKYLYFKQKHMLRHADTSTLTVQDIRSYFAYYLGRANSWSSEIWRERKFYLTDECLGDIHRLLDPIDLASTRLDVRSHALRQFLTPDIRKGLGIYLTPEDVVRAIVEFVAPSKDDKILDPACGSGTFLIEIANCLPSTANIRLHGIDKNPRMLLLADLNLTDHDGVDFQKSLSDSLRSDPFEATFDLILTNPPFGVTLDARDYTDEHYRTFEDAEGYQIKKQTSEIVFIERCFQLLRTGGTLAIVIPRSIGTNNRLDHARRALSKLGYITAIISLPPETFSTAGTQTTTIVLVARKYTSEAELQEKTSVIHATVKNVGFDATGRKRQGNELLSLPNKLQDIIATEAVQPNIRSVTFSHKEDTFQKLDHILLTASQTKPGTALGELCHHIGTGKTPARAGYSDSGGFLIKVGNLTSTGINWDARDRNHISLDEMNKRKSSKKPLILQDGDILITSSAHNSTYIAKKSDIFCGKPDFIYAEDVSFVGEVMLIRPDPALIAPHALLAYLRDRDTIDLIQQMVRGQTAHLHANDLKQLIVPDEVLTGGSKYSAVAELLREQTDLNEELNRIHVKQQEILALD